MIFKNSQGNFHASKAQSLDSILSAALKMHPKIGNNSGL